MKTTSNLHCWLPYIRSGAVWLRQIQCASVRKQSQAHWWHGRTVSYSCRKRVQHPFALRIQSYLLCFSMFHRHVRLRVASSNVIKDDGGSIRAESTFRKSVFYFEQCLCCVVEVAVAFSLWQMFYHCILRSNHIAQHIAYHCNTGRS